MVASTALNASFELARAIASMHTILRADRVIASGFDDQRYALGDWPRYGYADFIAFRGVDQTSADLGRREAPAGCTGGKTRRVVAAAGVSHHDRVLWRIHFTCRSRNLAG